jgi:hypothetical protein
MQFFLRDGGAPPSITQQVRAGGRLHKHKCTTGGGSTNSNFHRCTRSRDT